MPNPTEQSLIFERIRSLLPPGHSLTDDLSELLGISKDSVYRRIKGEKPLSFDELALMAKTFGFSLDEHVQPKDTHILFNGNFINTGDFNLHEYLGSMLRNLRQVQSAPDSELFYLSKDIPVFYYFMIPEIAAFKTYAWMKTQLPDQDLPVRDFSPAFLTEELRNYCTEIARSYTRIPSTEILNADNILNDLRQLEYYKHTGAFENPGDFDLIYDKLDEMVVHMKKQASLGLKFMPGEIPAAGTNVAYRLYANDFFVGDNTVIARIGDTRLVFLNHAAINFISTGNPGFSAYNTDFMQNIIKKSNLISEVGERTRDRFFNLIHERIDLFRQNRAKTITDA